jgi:putative SOS response-associated peptidase YedK
MMGGRPASFAGFLRSIGIEVLTCFTERHEGRHPIRIGGLWENWKDPTSGGWLRTFAIITTEANELVAEIHDRMPLIPAPSDYDRWLSDEPDPRDLMRPFTAEPMRLWPISTQVNKPENDDPSIIEPIEVPTSAAWMQSIGTRKVK